ncbi:MAG: GIY-YIG nuclease family protein [Candidatus Absconditabacterales bacterium]
MEQGFVYILSMNNGKYYTGSTTDLERRITQHQNGLVKSTKLFIPIGLLYSRKYDTIKEARQKEYLLKKQKDRKQIERFMQGL